LHPSVNVSAAVCTLAPGIVVYSYALCSEPQPGDSISLMDALKAGPFAQPDTVPALAWK